MMLIGLWVLRILIIMMVLRMVVRAFSPRPAPARRRPQRGPIERPGGTLVRDPQCGTYIPEARALTVGKGPHALHFCSAACRDQWAKAHS